jgi:hypothetical protein
LLSKELCDKYGDGNAPITGLVIADAPCFYNSAYNTSDTMCVSKMSLSSCSNIKTNRIVLFDGEERESCNEADVLFDPSFMCAWVRESSTFIEFCNNSFFIDIGGSFPYIMV